MLPPPHQWVIISNTHRLQRCLLHRRIMDRPRAMQVMAIMVSLLRNLSQVQYRNRFIRRSHRFLVSSTCCCEKGWSLMTVSSNHDWKSECAASVCSSNTDLTRTQPRISPATTAFRYDGSSRPSWNETESDSDPVGRRGEPMLSGRGQGRLRRPPRR